jgi:hypothetical protein
MDRAYSELVGGCSCPNSSDTYQTTFSLAGLDPSTAVLNFTMLVDNDITVVLNGSQVFAAGHGLSTLFTGTPLGFSVNSDFVAGTNTLDFIVGNGFGPTGVDAKVSGTATPIGTSAVPEPFVLVLCAGGLLAMDGLRRRYA